jgi:hypothetical protein
MKITLHPIKSSQISQVGYDATTNTLAVKFSNGGKVYHYAGVPKTVYDGFSDNGSAGKFFSGNVRNKFAHTLHDYEDKHHGKAETA